MKIAHFCFVSLVFIFCSCNEDLTVTKETITGSWITMIDLDNGKSAKRVLNLHSDKTWGNGSFIYTGKEEVFVLESGTWELISKEGKPYIKFRTFRSSIGFDPDEDRFVEINQINRRKMSFTFDDGSVELLTLSTKRIKPIVENRVIETKQASGMLKTGL